MSDDEDVPHLSAETFAVLQEFYKEQELKEKSTNGVTNTSKSIDVSEDWQLSQFWYDDSTIDTLINISDKNVNKGAKVALISCPSVYKKMKQNAMNIQEVTVYEYDKRFSIFGDDFKFYDYNFPLDLPQNKQRYYDLVLADPPFLSEECLTKTAETIKFLTKDKILLCTGATMSEMAKKLLNVEKVSFEPKHSNNLANEFWCYTNFNIDTMF